MPVTSSLPPTSERNANIDLISPLPSDACNLKMTKSEGARSQTKDKSMKRKSVLNTYSSEELLLQAASSLQGLEGIKIFMVFHIWMIYLKTEIMICLWSAYYINVTF